MEALFADISGGEEKFVHYTFWPSAVFTVAAIRDLTKLFNENVLLRDILRHTQIWATEEVILPTIVRLLGYDIESNPCSYDFVKYRKSHTLQELKQALDRPDCYWMHPVERHYDNALRRQARQHFEHYTQVCGEKPSVNYPINLMITTFSLLEKIREIEGWLSDKEADLLISATLKACTQIAGSTSILEIGSYQGKSTVLFGCVVKEYFPGVKIYAVDPHEGRVGDADQGIHSLAPTLEKFKKNIANAGLTEIVEPIQDFSFNVVWEKPIALLFIDGLHDYGNVARDFQQFSDWVVQGGYVAFHDYSDYYPGVQSFVNELLASGKYHQAGNAESLILVQKI